MKGHPISGQEVRATTTSGHQLTRRCPLLLSLVTLSVLLAGVALYSAGYNESFHSESEGVRGVFRAITELGNDGVYLVVLTLIYLAYDKRFGRRLCILFFFVVYVTGLLKEFFRDPRPPANLESEDPYSGYGFPSGHTTTSITFYGYIPMGHTGVPRARVPLALICGFAVVAVPVSRLVIGAHDVQDVAGGAVIALCLMIAYVVLLPRVAKVIKAWPLGGQLGIGVLSALLLWLMGSALIALRHPGDVLLALEETAQGAGLLMGCAIAFPIEEAKVGYRPDLMGWKRRLVAAGFGLPVTMGVFGLADWVSGGFLPDYAGDMLTYPVLMVVLGLLLPAILQRFLVVPRSSDPEA